MENGIKPGAMMLIGGGAVMFIASLLDWAEFGESGWSLESFGLLGIFVALFGIVIAVGVALTTFADVDLPDDLLGFSRTQVYVILAFAAFIATFGFQFADWSDTGVLLGWIGSAVAVAGGVMEMRTGASDTPAPPTQF